MSEVPIHHAFNAALQHHHAGRLAEAERIYRQILARQPSHIDALHNLGVLAHQTGRNDIAADLIRRAIALNPNFPEAQSNLGSVLRDLGQLQEAIAACRSAIALRPDYPEAHSNFGNALRDGGQLDDAIAAYRRAIALKPDFADAYNKLGGALRARGQTDEAIAAYRQAIAIRPNFAEAHCNLASAFKTQNRLDEAIALYRHAISLKPDFAAAHTNLAGALMDMGQLDAAIAADRDAIALNPNFPEAHSNLIFTMHYHRGYDAQTISKELRCWNQVHGEPLQKFIQPHSNNTDPNRRLRIGYLSPDFRDHAVARNLLPLLQRHDHRQFEIICYAQLLHPDAMTSQIQPHADLWRNITGVPDERVAQQIRQDRIDILVDLALHTAGNRLPIFARKPAPVQVTFAGYPGSTGVSAIDYRLSDPYLDPVGMDESVYSEKTIRLPATFWCYDPLENAQIPVNPLPAAAAGSFTFGCLNKRCKLNDLVIAHWAKVLSPVKDSRLLLLSPAGSPRQATLDRFTKEGIDPSRVQFVSQQPRQEYLQLYHRIDLGLDSFPYNGHTTSLDSLWMGVPMVTLVGQSPVSRAGWSQLSNLGLPELAADTPEQFVKIAVNLANDIPRLSELRQTLRARMQASPLMDADAFARNIEAAYRRMWQTWTSLATR